MQQYQPSCRDLGILRCILGLQKKNRTSRSMLISTLNFYWSLNVLVQLSGKLTNEELQERLENFQKLEWLKVEEKQELSLKQPKPRPPTPVTHKVTYYSLTRDGIKVLQDAKMF